MLTLVEFIELNEVHIPGEDFEDGSLSNDEAREIAKKSALKDHSSGKIDVVATYHGAARAVQRHGDKGAEHWQKFSDNIAKFLKNRPKETKSAEYLAMSKSAGHGAVVNLEYTPNKKQIRYITVLPKGKKFAKEGTQKFMIEGLQKELEVVEVE